MRIETIELPTGNPLTDRYIQSFNEIKHLFHWNPWQSDSFLERAKQLRARWTREKRRQLVEAITDYHRSVGASPLAAQSANRLLEPDAVAVVTGQQAGLLSGPLYTIHKALTAIAQAKRIEQETGVPCVPVFWVAAEDHDYDEVNHCYVLNGSGQPVRIPLRHRPAERTMVGAISVPPQALEQLLTELNETVAPSEYRGEILALIEEAWSDTTNMADWCVALLARLFANTSLVFVNAAKPLFRACVKEVFAQAIRNNDTLRHVALEGAEAVRQAGFTPQVDVTPGGTMLFYIDEQGKRWPIDVADSGFVVRGAEQAVWSASQLTERAFTSPQSFSSGVLLRPVIQDFLIPTLAYVGGAAEVAYHAIQKGLFEQFSITMPIVLPRFNATIVDATTARYLDKYDLSPSQFFTDKAPVAEYLRSVDPVGISERFDNMRNELASLYEELLNWLPSVHEQMSMIGEKSRQSVLHRIDLLQAKTEQLHRLRYDVVVRQFERMQGVLKPDHSLQERMLCIIGCLFKYGPNLVADLAKLELGNHMDHRLIYL